jgi:hypothetical protein
MKQNPPKNPKKRKRAPRNKVGCLVGHPPCASLSDWTLVIAKGLSRGEEASALFTGEFAHFPMLCNFVS